MREQGTRDRLAVGPGLGQGQLVGTQWKLNCVSFRATRLEMFLSSHSRPPLASQSPWSQQRPGCPVFLENEYALGILGKGPYLYLETKPAALEGYRMCTLQNRHVLPPESKVRMPLWARHVIKVNTCLFSSVGAVPGMR